MPTFMVLNLFPQRRNQRHNSGSRGEPSARMQERAFCLGLTEECPRCGADGLEFAEGEDARRDSVVFESRCKHLQVCNDAAAHAAYRSRKELTQRREAAREEKALAQDEVQQLAAWEFLGANQSQLWMLEEG